MDNVIQNIREKVLERIDISRDISEEELWEAIDGCICEMAQEQIIPIRERREYARQVFNSIKRLDILQELIDDDSISEIMVNGYENIYIEKEGRIEKWDKQFECQEKLLDIAQQIAAKSNRIINESIPILDTRLSNGSRVNMVLPPVALDGPIITIRKFYSTPITIERLIEMNSISQEAAVFLENLVKAKYNIFVSGGTGSGKTTFLNALSNYIPAQERVITIEDSAELQIHSVKNLVRLETKNANIEGNGQITIRDLIKSSLRMRPDRIIVGEVRGEEAVDMLQAMNTGHDGSLSTGHANSTTDMISRLETMVLMGMDIPIEAIRSQIASAIDIIVHLGRIRDKTRKVLEISEVSGMTDGNVTVNKLYEFVENGEEKGMVMGKMQHTGNRLINQGKLRAAGIKKEDFFNESIL